MNYGWLHPETAFYYERFCRRYARYRQANAALVRHADLCPGLRVLDAAAGTGRTAEAAMPFLGPRGRIICFEPSAAMRAAGRQRLPSPRIRWTAVWPGRPHFFHRILIGASIWQMLPLDQTFRRAATSLKPGGALCFNIPSLYLGQPDEPGGGADPRLLQLPRLAAIAGALPAAPAVPLPSVAGIDAALTSAGLRPTRWTFRLRLTQSAYRDWLKIPVLTDVLLAGLDARQRALRLDEAFRQTDPASWRWEHWTGWTAWK